MLTKLSIMLLGVTLETEHYAQNYARVVSMGFEEGRFSRA